ncbi:MAG: GntR family transcriptional regulator [Clostridia bacterium]|nr:GntR family transcriptional regulator [Clostridia bacterium]
MNCDFDNNIPIYIQVVKWLENEIISSRLSPGDKLPSVRDLANQFQVNPNTIQRAYREIEQKGLCHTRRGMGSFVTDDKVKIKKLLDEFVSKEISDFTDKMSKMGLSDFDIKKAIEQYLNKGEIND